MASWPPQCCPGTFKFKFGDWIKKNQYKYNIGNFPLFVSACVWNFGIILRERPEHTHTHTHTHTHRAHTQTHTHSHRAHSGSQFRNIKLSAPATWYFEKWAKFFLSLSQKRSEIFYFQSQFFTWSIHKAMLGSKNGSSYSSVLWSKTW